MDTIYQNILNHRNYMKRVAKAYKFRLYPTKTQEVLLNKHFGCTRKIYNYFLDLEQKTYNQTKKFNFYNANTKALAELKKDPKYSYLKEVNNQSLQRSIKFLDQAFKNCFKHKHCKFPKFKSVRNKQSFKVPVNSTFKIKNNKLFIPKFRNGIKIMGRPNFIGPKFLNVTVSKNNLNEYFASVQYEDFIYPKPKNSSTIAFDLGIKTYLVTSNGKEVEYPKFFKRNINRLKKEQQVLSHKTKGSNNFNKQKKKVAKIHKDISNQRLDFLHKLSTQIVSENQVIILEDLSNKKLMSKNYTFMNRELSDASFGMFIGMIMYKSEWYQRACIKIDSKNTSRMCNHCHHINDELTLDDRTWVCELCGSILDRDINAAKNILDKGLKILGGTEHTTVEPGGSTSLDEVLKTSEKEAIYL